MTAIVAIDHVTKRYRGLTALDGLDLALAPGETVALVGHNGAGKTTLMKLVLGLIRPSGGQVRVLGTDPSGAGGAAARRHLGFLPESVAFHNAMTGRELLAFYARLKGAPPAANDALLAEVGLAEAAGRRVGTYSKGMRQRLGLAQALIGAPRLLLLDEPTSGLDPESRARVYATIDRLRGQGATILVSTHALAEIEGHADRIALLHRGRLLAAAPLATLRAQAALPIRVRLTVATCSTGKVLEVVGSYARLLERTPDSVTLAVGAGDKLTLIGDLERLKPWLIDLDIGAPGLEALYRHFVDRMEVPA